MGLTTNDVCEKFIKPPTFAQKSSYCELLRSQNHPAVGTATVFISHAWKYYFLDVVDALVDFFKDDTNIFIWFDMFSNNQHKAVDFNFDWWCNTFKSAIKQFGHTVMIISPWSDPVTLTRAWCLFEIYCTIDTKSKFDVAMSDAQQELFIKDMEVHGNDAIDKMLSLIDAERSVCFHAEDKALIFDIVKKSIGFDGVNALVFNEMRSYLISVAEECFDRERRGAPKIQYGIVLGQLYTGQGRLLSAAPILKASVMAAKALLGEWHVLTVEAQTALAMLLQSQDRFQLAEPLYAACLEKRRKLYGDDHASTLTALNNLATIYSDLGRFQEALPLCERCLELRAAKLGPLHQDTLASESNLAALYRNTGQLDRAQELAEQCARSTGSSLGEDHPDTLVALNNLASILEALQRYGKAEELLLFVLDKRATSLGDDHPLTLSSMFNLAAHYRSRGRLDNARPLLKECTERRINALGPTHPDTLLALKCLANIDNDRMRMSVSTENIIEDL